VESAVASAHAAGTAWRTVTLDRRLEHAQRLAELLQAEAPALARQMAGEIGKPVRQARAEVLRGADLVRVAARWAREPGGGPCGEHSEYRDRPLGVVAAITPWNNPVAIPLAKIVAALLFGNAVVWKPAPAVAAISSRLHDLIDAAGFPPGLVRRVCGDAALAGRLMSAQGVAAVSLTGSLAAGRAAQEICARRNLPLQAELGGNNAAIVWPDCDLDRAATLIAEAAFGFAGQRCTATRRVIIEDSARAEFLDHLATAVDALVWGDPLSENTDVGPLVSATAAQRIADLVARAQPSAQMLFQSRRPAPKGDAFFPPTVFACDDALAEIVQEESFGPVLVVQPAHDFEQALSLCNGVPQGLVAALLSRSPERQARFLDQAQAGILKLGSATADADVEAPFGGWKASGVGPPEHGRWDRSFFTRAQAVYRRDG
jgi:acyl-CoA reductase-like NAD-dependent aldehyde dehydrogenase